MRGLRWIVLLVVIAAAAACGDAEEPAARRQFDSEAYCAAEFRLETLPPFESEDADELKKFASETLLPAHERALAEAPSEIRDEFATLVDAASEMASSGDPHGFGSDDVREARRAIHTVDLDTCGWKRVDVTAHDYRFEGLGESLAGGRTSFELVNEGKEPHEFVLFRVNEGVSETIEELLELPEDEVMEKVSRVGAAFAEPGEREHGVVDLKSGRHGAVCFIPVGGDEEGPPHFTEGMHHEFVVE